MGRDIPLFMLWALGFLLWRQAERETDLVLKAVIYGNVALCAFIWVLEVADFAGVHGK
jgi:hypothetical protein